MRRYTTPRITVHTEEDLTKWPVIVLTVQDKAGTEVNVTGPNDRMFVDSEKIVVKLTQEETGSLLKGTIRLQIRASSADGVDAIASNIMTSTLDDVLREGVIGG